MRLAVVAGKFPAPSETFVLGQVKGLIDLGHEVDVYANRRGRGWSGDEDSAQYRLIERTRLRPKRNLAGLVRAARVWARHPLIAARCLNIARYGSEASSLRLLFSMAPWLEGHAEPPHYDAVIAHFGHNARVIAMLRDAGAFTGPLLAITHGTDVTKAHPRDYRFLFNHADLILPVSDMLRSTLLEWGAPAGRCTVQRTGVDLSRFTFRERTLDPTGTLRLITVARLVEVKGIEFAIRAIASLPPDHRGRTRYDIVGDGPLRERLSALIDELALRDHITLRGALPHDDVARALDSAHIAILPSIITPSGQREGLGLSLAEAMATGLPVIATNTGGIPELVEDNVSGYLVAPQDPSALAAKIERLATHPETWPTLGRAGRDKVERDFDLTAQNRRLLQLLEGL
jgi:colanic acid/amylovoran biosynthesis glycosyltransferase